MNFENRTFIDVGGPGVGVYGCVIICTSICLVELHKQAGIRGLKGKILWEGNLDERRQARFIADTGAS